MKQARLWLAFTILLGTYVGGGVIAKVLRAPAPETVVTREHLAKIIPLNAGGGPGDTASRRVQLDILKAVAENKRRIERLQREVAALRAAADAHRRGYEKR